MGGNSRVTQLFSWGKKIQHPAKRLLKNINATSVLADVSSKDLQLRENII